MEMKLAIILVSSASDHSNPLFEYLTHLKSNDAFRAALLCKLLVCTIFMLQDLELGHPRLDIFKGNNEKL